MCIRDRVTGEGRLDGQSAMGKVPVGVAKAGRKNGCKVIALAAVSYTHLIQIFAISVR